MEKYVKQKLGGVAPGEIKKLILDGCSAQKISGITDQFTSLDFLSMNNVGLKTLEGLPSLPSLKKLEVCDNYLSTGMNVIAEKCPNLEKLALSGNEKLNTLECIEPLKKLEKLKAIEMLACGIAKIKDYRDVVFKALPQIKFLDTFSATDEEEHRESEDEEESEEDDYDDEDDDVDSDGDDIDEVERGPGLKALYDTELADDDDDVEEDEDEDEEEEEDSDDDDEEEEKPAETAKRGEKRKHEEEEDGGTNA